MNPKASSDSMSMYIPFFCVQIQHWDINIFSRADVMLSGGQRYVQQETLDLIDR